MGEVVSLLGHPHPAWFRVSPRGSRSRRYRREMARLSVPETLWKPHSWAPQIHVCPSILPFSSLNNQNFFPI